MHFGCPAPKQPRFDKVPKWNDPFCRFLRWANENRRALRSLPTVLRIFPIRSMVWVDKWTLANVGWRRTICLHATQVGLPIAPQPNDGNLNRFAPQSEPTAAMCISGARKQTDSERLGVSSPTRISYFLHNSAVSRSLQPTIEETKWKTNLPTRALLSTTYF